MQNKQLIFKKPYETDQPKTKSADSFSKSTDNDAKQTNTNAKTNSPVLNTH